MLNTCLVSDMNLGDKRTRISPNSLWVSVIHVALLLKAFLKGISELLVLGLNGRKDSLLNDLSEPPSWSDLGDYQFRFFEATADRNSIPSA